MNARMKIAWYTPFSTNSAIGRFSHLVVRELRLRGVDVTIVRSEVKGKGSRQDPFDNDDDMKWAADFDRSSKLPLDEYDLVVYNLGDHYENHAYCFSHQQRQPGISILHDFSLHNALFGFCNATTPTNGSYREQLAAECGETTASRFDELLSTGQESSWWGSEVGKAPIYRWALRNTLGIVAHADFYRETVESRIGCPTTVIPLAYDSPCSHNSAPRPALYNAKSDRDSDRIRLVTVGAVNANKQYGAIIETLANNKSLLDRIEFRVVGPINSLGRQMLDQLLNAQANKPRVTITGEVTASELKTELAEADIISCLRLPALEGASASVIEGMLSGRPILVCNTGCYSEIPSELVYHVNPDRLHSDLNRHLEGILRDLPAASRRSEKAMSWALERHSPVAYAEALESFIPRVLYNQPVLDVTDRISRQFSSWNLLANDALLNRMDRAIHDLFGPHDPNERAA